MTSKDQDNTVQKRPSIDLCLENFRLFKDSGWFKLAPLTCLVGRNSSGKSTVLSSILLLKQSIEQERTAWGAMPLVLSGQYCDLGNYTDLVYNHRESSEISFSFSVSFVDLQTSLGERGIPFVNLAIRPRRDYSGDYYGYREEKLPKRGGIRVRLGFASEGPFGPTLRRFEIDAGSIGKASFSRIGTERRARNWQAAEITLPQRSLAVDTYPSSFFPSISFNSASYKRCSRRMQRRLRMFVSATRLFFNFIQQGLRRSQVVGPFRTPPERRYAFGGFGTGRSGPSGEQTIDFLITELLLKPPEGKRSLHTALSFWIKHLKLANSLDVSVIAKRLNLFEVDVSGAGRGTTANLADVGFGLSQILPVLVQGLLMRPGGVYLVQQPEIHLHPDAQAGLADFFIYLASYGVKVLVETHSEYLLLRLRRRLAEGSKPITMGLPTETTTIKPLATNDVSILFTGFEGKEAKVRQLYIGSSFQFENLPTGFMSQALEDRVALLKALKEKND
jgi:predicted ATPase